MSPGGSRRVWEGLGESWTLLDSRPFRTLLDSWTLPDPRRPSRILRDSHRPFRTLLNPLGLLEPLGPSWALLDPL